MTSPANRLVRFARLAHQAHVRSEQGSILVAVVILLTIAASLGTAIYSFVSTGSLTQIGSMNDTKAYYLAESGGYYGIKELTDPAVNLSTDFVAVRDTLIAQPFIIENAGQFSLQNFTSSSAGGFLEIRFESVGVPADADITRKINYIVKVPDPAGTPIPLDGNPDNWIDNGPVTWTPPAAPGDAPTVVMGGSGDAQISLDWDNANSTLPALDEVRDDANGLLTYEAQVKVKLNTSQDVMAGISFRLNTGGNTSIVDDSFYGLSYLWCESSSSGRDLPDFCGSQTSKTYIVLWKQASNGSKTIIGKKLASSVTSSLVSSNALVSWATLVVRLQEQFDPVTGLRENMIYAFVGTPDTSPKGTVHWDYTDYLAVQWEASSFTGTDCSGGQRFFITDSSFTTENFATVPQDEVGLHVFGRAQAEMADLAIRFNFDGGVATECVASSPGTIVLTSSTFTKSEGGGTLTITARRTLGSVGAIGVSYAVTGGTATADQDYTFTPGTLAWADGDTADKTFTIDIIDDAEFESAETINLALSAPTGWAMLGVPNTAIVTITDNDGISTCDTWPGSALKSGTTSLSTSYVASSCPNRLLVCAVTAELGSQSSSFTVNGSYGGSDFTLLQSTSGKYSRQHVWLGYVDESGIVGRATDTVSLSVSGGSSPTGTNLYCATYSGVDQSTPVAGSRANYNSGSSTVSFGGNVAVTQGGVIFYALAANGARSTPPSGYLEHWDQSLSNYSQSGGSKQIAATGSENKSWWLSSSERWGLAVGSLNPGAGGGGPGTIAFASGAYSQDEDAGSITITVSRIGGSNGAVSVDYATMNGTATTAGADYTAASGTLSWTDGDTADKSFTVDILDDSDFEGDETVNLSITNVQGGATLGSLHTAELTIVDNETPPAAVRYDLTYDASAPSVGVDGAIDALAQTSYSYYSTSNRNRAPLRTGVTLSGTRGRYSYGSSFSGTNYEMVRAYTPPYTSANGKILANIEVSVDYYIRSSGGNTGKITAQLYEYNDSSGVVGSVKGSWTSSSFSTTSIGNAITLSGTINNPTFTVAAGNRLEVRFLISQNGGDTALLYGATKSGTNGNTFISVIEMAAGPDTTPPEVSSVTVTPSSNNYTSAAPVITATLTDAESPVTDCEYTTNGSTWTAGVVNGTASPWTCTGSPSALTGSLTINVRATSTGGVATGTAVTRTVDNTAPIHSGTFTATPTSETKINLIWPSATDSQAGMRSSGRYKVVRATGATPPADCTGTAVYSGTSTSYTNSGLSANTQYTYRVCAYDAVDNVTSGLTATAVTPTSSTYNFQADSGTVVASGVTTNNSSCGTSSMNAVIRTLMDKIPHECSFQRVVENSSGAQYMLDVYATTAYSSTTDVTGTSLKIRLRNGSSSSWVAGVRLVHIAPDGTITNFTGSEVTQSLSGGADQTYTLSLSGQSATVPVGSKLGIRIRSTTGSSTDKRIYYGSQANTSSGTSGVLIVNEAVAAADITPPTVGSVTVSPLSGAYTTASPTITASLTDLESLVTACEYTTNGSTWQAGVKSGSASPWTCTASPTSLSGALTVNMRGTSTGGLGTGTPVALTVDATGPANGVLTVTPGNAHNTLLWTAASDAGSGLRSTNTYDIRFQAGSTAPSCSGGSSIYTGTGLTVTHNSLTNGTPYSYRLCAYDALNNVSTGATGTATPGDDTPPVIGTVAVTPTSGSYTMAAPTITATITDGESAVTACEYTTNGSTWVAGVMSGSASPWTCTGSASGLSGTATFNVRATSTGGTGTGTSVSRTVDVTAPAFSGVLTATAASSTQISLSWPAATDGGSGMHSSLPYKVVRAVGVTAPADCTGTAIYNGTATSFADSGLNPTTQYAYRVCAYDKVNNVNSGLSASATTQSGSSAIAVASQWQVRASGSSATYTAGSGSNRLVLIAVHYEYSSSTLPTVTATYGGHSVTQINRSNNGRNDVWLGYIKEVDIPSGSATISVSFNNTPSARTISAATYANVDQSAPVLASTLGNTPTSGNSGSNPAFSGLYADAGGYVVMVDSNNGNATSPASNYSEHYDQADATSNFRLYAASRAITTAGNQSATFTMSSTRFGMVAVSLKPSTGGGDTTPPTHSGSLTATPVSSSEIDLSWPAATDAGSGMHATTPYKLVRATGATPPADCTGSAVYSGTATSYNNTGRSASTQYSYRVCAYDVAGNVTTGLTASATTQGVSAVTVASQWQVLVNGSSASYTAGSGSNRLVLIAIHYEYSSTTSSPTVTVTYGGSPATQIKRSNNGRNDVWLGYVKEASIPAGSATISVSFNTNPTARTISAATYAGVNQTSPIMASTLGNTPTSGNSAANPAFSGLAAATGGYVVMVDTNNGNSTSPASNYTEHYDQSDGSGNFRLYAASRAISSAGNQSATFTMSSTRFGMVAVSLQPGSGGGSDTTPPTDGVLTVTPGNAENSLSWTAATDAGGLRASNTYDLRFLTGSTAPTCASGTSIYLGTSLAYTHTGRTNGTQYSYRLCAYDAADNVSTGATGSGTPSGSTSITVLQNFPSTPQLVGGSASSVSGSFSIAAGSSRLLVVAVDCYDSGGNSGVTFSATYGNKTLTQAVLENSQRRHTWIGYLKEADIASRSGDTVAVTISGTHTNVAASIASYTGVNQATPVVGTSSIYNNATATSYQFPSAISAPAGGYGIYTFSSDSTRSSDNASYTEHSDYANGAQMGVASRAFAASTSTQPTVTYSGTARASQSIMVIRP